MQVLVAGLCGLVFGAGLAISGMTNPAKVLGFLDVFGAFDATLACVMGGALAVSAAGYAVARRREIALERAPEVRVVVGPHQARLGLVVDRVVKLEHLRRAFGLEQPVGEAARVAVAVDAELGPRAGAEQLIVVG